MKLFLIFIRDLQGPLMGPQSPLRPSLQQTDETHPPDVAGTHSALHFYPMQTNLTAIKGSILCVRLSTH